MISGVRMLAAVNSGLPDIAVRYQRGWSGGDYLDALRANRVRDIERGMTLSGPHRADLEFTCGDVPARSLLSRGEQKVLAAALLLTQAELLVSTGEKPVILLDDLASEFDALGVSLLGISPDTTGSHAGFRAKYGLKSRLAADPDRIAIDAYGVWSEKNMYGRTYMGVVRTTVIVAPDGTIAEILPVKHVKGHAAHVLERLKALGGK